jgi:hypothetical protein
MLEIPLNLKDLASEHTKYQTSMWSLMIATLIEEHNRLLKLEMLACHGEVKI